MAREFWGHTWVSMKEFWSISGAILEDYYFTLKYSIKST